MPRRRKVISIGGIGSTSRSLGGRDPRLRRNVAQLGESDVVTGGPIRIDKNQRITLKQIDPIAPVSDSASNAQLAGSIREIAEKLTRAELMKRVAGRSNI